MERESEFKKPLLILITVSTLIRVILAFTLELGNDEAYYWTYALYPDLSHFDQPPMIGWIIQLFTLNLFLSGEIFIRLAAIVFGSINTWLLFIIGRRLKNRQAGFYAALLYTVSPYCFIATGTFMIPDSALSFFYLISMFFLLEGMFSKYGINRESITLSRLASIITGVFIGLALLTKYSALFLWIGVLVYILIMDRKLIKNPLLYLSAFISFLFLLPMIIWNINNNFINIELYSKSIVFSEGINLNSFLKEIIGVLIYNNPFNVIIIITAIFSFRKNSYLDSKHFIFLLSLSLPLIFTYIFLSLFKSTLPHLSAPGFFGLILIAAAWLAHNKNEGPKLIPQSLKYSAGFLVLLVIAGFLQIQTGFIDIDFKKERTQVGKNDVTMDLYGWRQLAHKFGPVRKSDIESGLMNKHSNIIARKWYTAAHLDYYIASEDSISVKTIAPVEEAHKYSWITNYIGGLKLGESFYYFASSRDEYNIFETYKNYFQGIDTASTIYISRFGKPAERFVIYRLKNLIQMPPKELISPFPEKH